MTIKLFTLLVASPLLVLIFAILTTPRLAYEKIQNYFKVSKFDLPDRYKGNDKSVWSEYNELASEFKPVNLGQGFPDFFAPENIRKALEKAATSKDPLMNQYSRGSGHPRLVNAIAKLYSKILQRDLDPNNEVLITVGATEAIFDSIMGHTNPGDEWIIIEPFYDCYVPDVISAGGVPHFITLKPKKTSGTISSADWVFDEREMERLFNEKTKGIIINTPHNPLGKVFTLDELQFIADLAKRWNVLVVSDEVYEWIVYEPYQHIRIASLPGMYERTITIGSAGKTFSVTGWKIGWAYGPENLLNNLKVVHQNTVENCDTPTQEAVAIAFEEEFARFGQPDCYFVSLVNQLLPKRDFIVKFLTDFGMSPIIPEGGYVVLGNWTTFGNKVKFEKENDDNKDYQFTKWMIKNVGVLGIPSSAFYSEEHKHLNEDHVRFCFMKKDETLKKTADLLLKWKS